ncbi:MAG: hypothetical protein WCC60_24355 [Ilumatobacteraceae bacterium]
MSWLPADLPQLVELDGITFVPLTPALLEQDYAAVMRDIPMLRAWSGQDWPNAEFPIEWNLDDLQRHDREQQERVALTYSVQLHGIVQGCIYVRPLLDALGSRDITVPESMPLPSADVVVRGWLHDRPALDLIRATMSWLGQAPFAFPRLWWQTNSHCLQQLAACDELGLTDELAFEGSDRTWLMRAAPAWPAPAHAAGATA